MYFSYSSNCNTRRVFVIIFLICSDLLNCLRRVGTIAVAAASKWLKQPQSYFHYAFPHKSNHFSVLMYFVNGHPRYFKFKRKYQQYDPCYPRLSFGFLLLCFNIRHFRFKILINLSIPCLFSVNIK